MRTDATSREDEDRLLQGMMTGARRIQIRSSTFLATRKTLDDLARMFNASIRGWINYYGCYYKSALYPTLRHIDRILARWAHRKFKSLRRHRRRTQQWLARIARRQPSLFAHWRLLQGYG